MLGAGNQPVCNHLQFTKAWVEKKLVGLFWSHNHRHTSRTHAQAQTEDIKVETTNTDDENCDVTVYFRFPLLLCSPTTHPLTDTFSSIKTRMEYLYSLASGSFKFELNCAGVVRLKLQNV